MDNLQTEIVRIAKSYLGKTEKPGNSGFNDPEFEKKMKGIGWVKGDPWCADEAKLIWMEANSGDVETQKLIAKYCSGSSIQTYKNFKASKEFHVSSIPVIGAIVVWQEGNGATGHEGVVISLDGNSFNSVEGNTNDKGGSEGYICAEKTRMLNKPFNPNGLNVLGFIYPNRIKQL